MAVLRGMSRFLSHEIRFRGSDLIGKCSKSKILMCGAGSLGANLADNLCAHGFRDITIIDNDIVHESNLGNQPYTYNDVQKEILKVDALRHHVVERFDQVLIIYPMRLSAETIAMPFKHAYDLVIDVFDNAPSRKLIMDWCRDHDIPCVHGAMSGLGYSHVIWNEDYVVPEDTGPDPCDYPLAHNLVLATVLMLSEAIIRFVHSGEKKNFEFTLNDLNIAEIEP